MSLQERIDEIKKKSGEDIPEEHQKVMQKVTQDLVASGKADEALGVGDTAPDFTLLDTEGRDVSSAELRAEGPLVVTFYRGVW